MAVAEVELDGVATDHAPVFDGDTGKVLLIGATDLFAEQVALTGVLGAGRGSAECFHGDELLRSIAPNEGDFGADEFQAGRGHEGRVGRDVDKAKGTLESVPLEE